MNCVPDEFTAEILLAISVACPILKAWLEAWPVRETVRKPKVPRKFLGGVYKSFQD